MKNLYHSWREGLQALSDKRQEEMLRLRKVTATITTGDGLAGEVKGLGEGEALRGIQQKWNIVTV